MQSAYIAVGYDTSVTYARGAEKTLSSKRRTQEKLMRIKFAFSSLVCLTHLFLCAAAVAQGTNSNQSQKTLATVGGEALYENEFSSSIKGQLQRIRQQEFELKRKGLDELVRQKLIEAEAKRKGIAPEKLLQTEVDKRVARPTPGELEAYYLAQKQNISQSFEDVEGNLRESLRQAKIQAARDTYVKILQQKAEVISFLRPPRLDIRYDPVRLKGNPGAPVIIVEFSDFSCPFCREAESTLNGLIQKYQGKVSLAYRDFPLTQIHPQANMGAEASRCAAEQGKFWQYHDVLFSTSHMSDKGSLLEAAAKLDLDKNRFETCLGSGKYRAQIEADIQDATSAGVSGTPAFFINGFFLAGLQPAAAFEKIIDEQLDSAKQKTALASEPVSSPADQFARPSSVPPGRRVLQLSWLLFAAVICATVLGVAFIMRHRQPVNR